MVSFVCNYCQETLKKPKLDMHAQRCRNASFSCIDCSVDFMGTTYRQHTSCISEAEKYEGKLFKGNKKNANQKQNIPAQTQPQTKTTVDQLKERAQQLNFVQESAVEGKKRNPEATAEEEEEKKKKSKKEKKKEEKKESAWDESDLPKDAVEALVCAIAAHLGEDNVSDNVSFKDMKKKCIKMVTKHKKSKLDKDEVKNKFEEAVVAALSAGKVTLSKI
ncbi:hypothetical protein LPJ66_001603 [Kickxella alabastrina]|uniref:Uncharacterized protein n=1 Tax=Kickxella alabastrina TaxID=61397 RepID=A0ACC1IST1_9FUNG|nr:hypothetical protein LPJ66_001603 [Kickxella alabastrina]